MSCDARLHCMRVRSNPSTRNGSLRVRPNLLVVGLGYVGLPLAREASLAGLRVVGFDLNSRIVDGLNSGHSHVGDIADADVAKMVDGGSAPRRVRMAWPSRHRYHLRSNPPHR